jgi:carotenoid cleavage dioxygenase
MVHDFAMTSGHVIFMDLPVVFDMPAAQRGTMPFAWSETYGARLGILKRGAGIESLRWVEIEPCYVFHVANAFEEADGSIVIDVAWYSELWRGGPSATSFDKAKLRRWRVPPGATKAQEQTLDDRSIEFPRQRRSRRAASRHRLCRRYRDGGADQRGAQFDPQIRSENRHQCGACLQEWCVQRVRAYPAGWNTRRGRWLADRLCL